MLKDLSLATHTCDADIAYRTTDLPNLLHLLHLILSIAPVASHTVPLRSPRSRIAFSVAGFLYSSMEGRIINASNRQCLTACLPALFIPAPYFPSVRFKFCFSYGDEEGEQTPSLHQIYNFPHHNVFPTATLSTRNIKLPEIHSTHILALKASSPNHPKELHASRPPNMRTIPPEKRIHPHTTPKRLTDIKTTNHSPCYTPQPPLSHREMKHPPILPSPTSPQKSRQFRHTNYHQSHRTRWEE